jgi:poly-gamma-glutamate capsule biosynthesis protein CapA/YwtB (metallophosphatase superfamily)
MAKQMIANVKNIFEADNLTIANFEGTLTDSEDREDKQFAFKAPASYADILTAGSVEAVNTANNHSHDYGDQSFFLNMYFISMIPPTLLSKN